jgi:hypothetical protein
MLILFYLLHEQYSVHIQVIRLGDVFVYQYWRHPLLLVQVNTEQIENGYSMYSHI